MLNVPARFCVSFIGLARCVLRDSEGKLFIWSGAALVTPLGYAGSESLPATRIGQSRPRVWFPGSSTAWVFRYIEIRQLTLSHVVELLAIHGPVSDPCLSDLSEGHDLNSGVFGGADSTAPSSGRARRQYPVPQHWHFNFFFPLF